MTVATLTSNGASIPFTPHYFAELKSTDAGLDAASLRARYDGHVMLRGAVPAHAVLDLRGAYLNCFAPNICKGGDTRRFHRPAARGFPAPRLPRSSGL